MLPVSADKRHIGLVLAEELPAMRVTGLTAVPCLALGVLQPREPTAKRLLRTCPQICNALLVPTLIANQSTEGLDLDGRRSHQTPRHDLIGEGFDGSQLGIGQGELRISAHRASVVLWIDQASTLVHDERSYLLVST